MCLNALNIKMRARKPIACYKILKVLNGQIVSPFCNNYVWDITGNINTASAVSPYVYDVYKRFLGIPFVKVVKGGYFHTFKKFSTAMKYMEKELLMDKCILCKCVIPKGSTYYKGFFGNTGMSYACDSLIVDNPLFCSSCFLRDIMPFHDYVKACLITEY